MTEKRKKKKKNGASVKMSGERQEFLKKQPVELRIRHLRKEYNMVGTEEKVVALHHIHLCEAAEGEEEDETLRGFPPIKKGEFVMIRGPSGGGKTTLLNIIGTIDSCTGGSVELSGDVIDANCSEAMMANIRLSKIGFVFQTFNLLSSMTAVENVELPMTLQGKLSSKERRERAKGLLQLVGLHNRANHLPSELSGGEQQRVTIARSLANNPSLLLLDEPTGDLDTQNTIDVMDLLIQLNRLTQCTLIMVTHNPDLECYADRILYVSDGRFARQVINVEPQGLDYDRYNEYLKRKETEKTQLIDVDV
ncbi:ATP-binding protein cassette protein subfamily H, member 2 [Angomonas deanei]|nr:ATP-binding protein cassette protein subfamily H, member 2 [Angomonas deanei]|eukprot:EPY27542.1 ATP-binding protein cassette protein subfamily H, member 2 [Angomonas deanei]